MAQNLKCFPPSIKSAYCLKLFFNLYIDYRKLFIVSRFTQINSAAGMLEKLRGSRHAQVDRWENGWSLWKGACPRDRFWNDYAGITAGGAGALSNPDGDALR